MPQIVVAEQEVDLLDFLPDVPLECFKNTLICQDINLLAVMKEIAEEDDGFDIMLLGSLEYPFQYIEAILQPL
jgi:hypothetical protein